MQLDLDNRVTLELQRAKDNNRLLHIYLFYGGDNKTMLDEAKYFASMLYCGCLECETCKNIINNNHLNVHILSIESGKTMITKEQIQDLENEFSLTSLVAGPRVYIINGIDTASSAAQNSLLKFIEEPNNVDEVYGILIANNLNNVLTTIKSRCGLVRFMPKNFSDARDELMEFFSIDDSFMLASIDTNINTCKELIEDKNYLLTKEMVFEYLKLKDDKEKVVFYLNHSFIDKVTLRYFINILINMYHECLVPSKLLSSVIYDKITLLRQNESKEILKDKLTILLELDTRIKYNVIEKNILHELIMKI